MVSISSGKTTEWKSRIKGNERRSGKKTKQLLNPGKLLQVCYVLFTTRHCSWLDSGTGGQEKSSSISRLAKQSYHLVKLSASYTDSLQLVYVQLLSFKCFLHQPLQSPHHPTSNFQTQGIAVGGRKHIFLCCGLQMVAHQAFFSFFLLFFLPPPLMINMIYRPELLFIMIHFLSPVHWRLIEMPACSLIYLVKYLFQGLGQMIGVWASFRFMHYEKQADLTLSR